METHLDDGRKVVVGENDVRGFLGNVSSSNSHREANVGLFQRGTVVRTIAWHAEYAELGVWQDLQVSQD